eukprot:CAMPEP_0201510316 /NCGR_PEP_ID=MMETSP0161_2-20130828/3056_1 /ASSEMBLY_ACC=CAM_ASM_000251 /TAXON_ID=180227 /ORGANISM="Neoparamoeba aestuarina, Strain SoJaBio B1-5/56/2" /LENGTH=205 /DNA_ID=CAMNT_0047905469 /DNA_START=314 /DNA_END=931 /DNA_ORIENTATION=-
MTQEQFIRNNRGINDGDDLPREYLMSLYDDIVNNEIKIKQSSPFPRALKSGWVNMKCQSWVLSSRRWVVLSDSNLCIFKSETETEPSFEISLKSATVAIDHKRKKLIIRSRDPLQTAGGNFPVKIDIENEKDFEEWCHLILGSGKKKEFRPLNYAASLRKKSPRPIRLARFESATENELSDDNLSQYDLDSDASESRTQEKDLPK